MKNIKWKKVGKQMMINLDNAREQYSVLGYPHRIFLQLKCPKCNMITSVDRSIVYEYCPHCGVKIEGE